MAQQPHVLVCYAVHPEGLARIRTLVGAGKVDVIPPFPLGTVLPPEQIATVNVLFGDYPPHNLHDMKALEWFQLSSAGFEQLRGYSALIDMGVRVSNASGANDVPIAEWCLLMMLMFERDVRRLLELQRTHQWVREDKAQSELRGRRVGIIGYGNIGRELARLCKALGMEVWAMGRGKIGPRLNRYTVPGTGDPKGILPDRTFTMAQMADFLPHLDYVVLTLARNAATDGFFGEREFKMMRPTAVILNPARGPLIQEQALLRALRENWIAGAALDTHYVYPMPPEHPLWDMPNVIMTPHISGSSGARHFLARLWDLFAQNMERYLNGQPLLNEVSPEQIRGVQW